jgi:hypothetical protein
MTNMNRRQLLQAFGAAAGAGAAGAFTLRSRKARAAATEPYFLIVLPAFGGGAIIDSFLPIKESEATDPAVLDCFSDAEVVENTATPIRIVDAQVKSALGSPLPQPVPVPLSNLAADHFQQMMVTTLQGTSVNHAIAQHRALTGGGAWNGRTLQECVTLAYGEGFPLPNVNMSSLGFLVPGDDPTLPASCYAEAVAQPLLKPLSLSGYDGINDLPPKELIDLARQMRNDDLDPESSFHQTFRLSKRLELWKKQREAALTIEQADLINKLIFINESPAIPFSDFGLSSSPDAQLLNDTFGDLLADPDPLHHQAALAFLMLKYRVSVTVTVSPGLSPVNGGPFFIKNPPLAFDGSHNDHRFAQALMWNRVMGVADKLIQLLEATPYDEDTGESMWDRTMIHFATDFGRSKKRPANSISWGTAHDLNNGTLTISPLVNGNTVLGDVHKGESVDLDGHTYGFDLQTGVADPSRTTAEAEHFAGLLQALKIDTSPAGLPDVPAMRKG